MNADAAPDYEIRDADLLEQLNTYSAGMREVMHGFLAREQQKRDRRARLTVVERRREEIREHIEEHGLAEEDRYHIHSVLALCGLPYRRPKDEDSDYSREYGKNSLVVQAGYLKDPETGRMEKQGIPYGPKARLLMLHICTMAIRQNSHEITVEDSMSAFIRELGFPVTGGKRGTIAQFKEQLRRLAAARMQIGLWNGDRALTVNSQPIEAFDVWLPKDPAQRVIWNSKLYLDKTFFHSLKEHALPINIMALRGVAQSAKQIDIMLWLGYRMRTIKKPYLIVWDRLKEQFGSEISRQRKMKETFTEDLKAIRELYPKLPVQLEERGLRLFPADPETLFVPPKHLTKAR